MSEKCAHCNKPAQGNYGTHRDGPAIGPEVDLCDACGCPDGVPLEEIWDRISTMVWVEKAVVLNLLNSHGDADVVSERAPLWQVATASSFAHSTVLTMALGLEFKTLFDKVAADSELQRAVTAASRLGAQGFEVLTLITDWRGTHGTASTSTSTNDG